MWWIPKQQLQNDLLTGRFIPQFFLSAEKEEYNFLEVIISQPFIYSGMYLIPCQVPALKDSCSNAFRKLTCTLCGEKSISSCQLMLLFDKESSCL